MREHYDETGERERIHQKYLRWQVDYYVRSTQTHMKSLRRKRMVPTYLRRKKSEYLHIKGV